MNWFQNQALFKKNGDIVSSSKIIFDNDLLIFLFNAFKVDKNDVVYNLLPDLYKTSKSKNIPMEIIYVSMDNNEEDMEKSISKHGDWYHLKYQSELSYKLMYLFSVSSIPKIIIVKGNGKMVTTNGVSDIEQYGINAILTWISTPNEFRRRQEDEEEERAHARYDNIQKPILITDIINNLHPTKTNSRIEPSEQSFKIIKPSNVEIDKFETESISATNEFNSNKITIKENEEPTNVDITIQTQEDSNFELSKMSSTIKQLKVESIIENDLYETSELTRIHSEAKKISDSVTNVSQILDLNQTLNSETNKLSAIETIRVQIQDTTHFESSNSDDKIDLTLRPVPEVNSTIKEIQDENDQDEMAELRKIHSVRNKLSDAGANVSLTQDFNPTSTEEPLEKSFASAVTVIESSVDGVGLESDILNNGI